MSKPKPYDPLENPVIPLPKAMRASGMCREALMAAAARGELKILKLNTHRYGIRASDWEAFLASRELAPEAIERPKRKKSADSVPSALHIAE